MLDRLHKLLARAGVAALRPAEDMILQGRVTVNGRIVRELGARADPETDVITVDGNIVHVPAPTEAHRYLLLHKPAGVISTAHDTHERPTVLDLVPNDVRVFPVGRLDADSEGLMLITDDGDLAYRLTHPRFGVEKEYRVLVDRAPDVADVRRWRTGVEFSDGEMTAPAWVEVLERSPEGTWLRVVMHEGKKRQIREVARLLGFNVLRLIRAREGPITLGELPAGSWRELVQSEIEALRAHTQHVPSREADEEREQRMSQDDTDRPRRMRVIRRAPQDGAAPSFGGRHEPRPDEGETPNRGMERPREQTRPDDAPGATQRFDSRLPIDDRRNERDRIDRAAERRTSFDNRDEPPRGSRPDNRGRPSARSAEQDPRGRPPQDRGFGRAARPDDRMNSERGSGPPRDNRPQFDQRPAGGGPRRDDTRAGGFRRDDRERSSFGRGDENRGNFRSGPGGPGPRRDDAGARDSARRGDLRGGLGSSGRRGADGGSTPRSDGLRGGLGNSSRRGSAGGGPPRRDAPYRRGPSGPHRDDRPEFDGNRRDEANSRPSGPGSFGDRSRGPSGPRSFGDRSRGPSSPRPFGDRSRGPSGPRSFGDRSRGPSGPRSFADRPQRSDFRPPSERSEGNRRFDSRAPQPRRDEGGDRPPSRSFGDRRDPPTAQSFDRSRSGPSTGGDSGPPRSETPRGRSFGGKPSGPPRGGPARGRSGPPRRPGFRKRRDD